MEDNFYPEWERVYQAYQCKRNPRVDPETGKTTDKYASVCAPDTFATVNRNVARLTAQLPNIRFRSDNDQVAEMISRSLMYGWDMGDVQAIQKRHARQMGIFGWSVRPWSWERRRAWRRKRVDPFDKDATDIATAALLDFYKEDIAAEGLEGAPPQVILGKLLAKYGKGVNPPLLPVAYQYTAYEGPRCEFMFVGDCFPQPMFQGIQSSQWFICERRRDRQWFMNLAKTFKQFAPGVEELFRVFPRGTAYRSTATSVTNFRARLAGMEAASGGYNTWASDETDEWTITEQHTRGDEPTLALVAEKNVWLGELPYPYDLDGDIAFTEAIVIDNLLHGVGDSTVRVLNDIQELHSNLLSLTSDLYNDGLRPLVGTSDVSIYDNPEKIKKLEGFRLVFLKDGPGSLWTQDVSEMMQMLAAASGGEATLGRLWQSGTGDNNLSMGANVDPQQARTATGARLMTLNLDTLTRDAVSRFTSSSLRPDSEMMFKLYRSELVEGVSFDGASYRRDYGNGPDKLRQQWITAEPKLFQADGRITVEDGSTLADDDEARVEKAKTLMNTLAGNPHVNQRKLTADFLVSMGKRAELEEWMTPEQSGPSEPPPAKTSVSVSTKLELLPPDAQQTILQGAGLLPPPPPQGPAPGPQGPTPDQPPVGMEGPPMPDAPPTGAQMPGEAGVKLPGLPGIPGGVAHIPGDEPQQ